jgi:hypothetical protein
LSPTVLASTNSSITVEAAASSSSGVVINIATDRSLSEHCIRKKERKKNELIHYPYSCMHHFANFGFFELDQQHECLSFYLEIF